MSNQIIKIGIGQVELVEGDWQKNLDTVCNSFKILVNDGADITIFPELWPSALQLSNADIQAEINENEIYPRLKELSSEYKTLSHWGSMLRKNETGIFNQAHIVDQKGHEILQYRKIHLFGLMGEDKILTPGESTPVMETQIGKIASAICYDLRFPELFRLYALNGAGIVFIPAQWPKPRLLHWQRMIQARAIENQIFIVACNRVGKSSKYDFFGHSMIVDPWCDIVYAGSESAESACIDIDLAKISEAKAKLNSVNDINFDLFSKISKAGLQ